MKKIIYFFTFIACCLLSTGCEDDFLDQKNLNELNQDLFWANENDALKAITAAYGRIQADDRWNFFELHYTSHNYRADDIRATRLDLPFAASLAAFTNGADNIAPSQYWSDYYGGVFYANQVIENVPDIGMNVTTKEQIIGEAKFLRAFFHFNLLMTFKNIPLITTTPKEEDDFFPEQASEAAVWAQIEEDLKAAREVLPESYPEEFLGRATRGTAQAYLGKVHLFQEKWADAAAEFKAVIDGGNYDLIANYEDNFNGNSENGPESLFEIQHTSERPNGLTESTPLFPEQAPGALSGWEEFFPSDWLFEEMQKDQTPEGDVSDRVLGTLYFDHPEAIMGGVPYADVKDELGNEKLFFKKYGYLNDLSDGSITRSGMNIHLMRYADVLLMYAEALNEMGNTAEALQWVNQVRERSNAAPLLSMNQSELRQQIRHHERPVELAMEYNIRWYDLVRWNNGSAAKERIKSTLMAHGKPDGENFQEGKHEYYGIPLSDMDKNPKLEQNQGW